jgi:hypothetical protein
MPRADHLGECPKLILFKVDDSDVVPRFADGSNLPAGDATGVGMPGWLLVSST